MTDFEKQKNEAAERVREMNRRYKKSANLTPEAPAIKLPLDVLRFLRLDRFEGDRDRLLLLGLFLLLNHEKSEPELLYALLYLML